MASASANATDRAFSGSIAELYDAHLVPLLFEPYAADLVRRLASRPLKRVLEIAAGTGVVTRAMAAALPEGVAIVATDLNQAMLDRAGKLAIKRPVTWRQADALQLPFEAQTFDAVVCQFGVMFFPDRAKAYAEARRVLARGGVFLFNVWDRLEDNEFAAIVTTALADLFPDDPPRFLARTPYGYYDPRLIAQDLRSGGFSAVPQISTVAARSRAVSPEAAAIGFCQGTPLRNEIEARAGTRLAEATACAAEAIARRCGRAVVDGKIQAQVVSVAA